MTKKRFVLFFLGALFLSVLPVYGEVNPDGSFTSDIEVKIPAGAKNMAPDLKLQYTSTTMNGMLGTGWSLSGFSYITRFDNGRGIRWEGDDDYIHSQLGALILQEDGSFRTKRESFTRIESFGTAGDGPAYFVATDRSGIRFYYGDTGDSRIEAVGKAGSVRVWALQKVEDLHGNYYTIRYYEDRTNGDYYPLRIIYTQGPGLNCFRTIEFGYEARSDHWQTFEQNVPVRSNYRLKSIYVKTDGRLVRRYQLSYEYGSQTRISRLVKVTEYGCDNVSTLPEITIDWQEGGSGFTPSVESVLTPSGGKGLEYWNIDAGDVDGDGLSDLLCMIDDSTGTAKVFFASGDGSYSEGPELRLSPTGGKGIKHRNLPAGDLNADGKADLIRLLAGNNDTTGEARAMFSHGDGTFSEGPVFNLTKCGTAAIGMWNVVPGDVDGDARTDIIRMVNDSTGLCEALLSRGDGSFSPGPGFTLTGTGGGGITKWNIAAGDINGDGRADMLRTINDANGQSQVMLSSGDGGFTAGPVFTLTSTGGSGISRWNVIAGDVNGDGRSDILRTVSDSSGQSQILFSRGDGSFVYGPCFYLSATEGQGISRWNIPAGDINGDGKTDLIRTVSDGTGKSQILYSRGNGDFIYSDYVYLSSTGGVGITKWNLIVGDINGDAKTDILHMKNDSSGTVEILRSEPVNANYVTGIKNKSGGVTRITYRPATLFPGAITPGEEGPGISNNSPRLLVSELELDHGRGLRITKSYDYHNGRILTGEIEKREDLGFDWVEERNTATGESSRTYYKQDYPYNCYPERILSYAGSGELMAERNMVYDYTNPCPDTTLVRLLREEEAVYNLGSLLYTTTGLHTYDAWGNILTREKHASGLQSTVITNSYVNDTENWILGRLISTETRSGTALLHKEAFAYTGNRLTAKTVWQSEGLGHSTSFSYDINGNLRETTDPLGRVTGITYDPVYHVYVTTLSNPKEQTITYAYDAWGNLLAKTDRNGLTTTYTWDEFHRKTGEFRPDGGYTKTAYVLQGNPQSQYIENSTKVDSRVLVERTYFDGGEFIYQKQKTADEGWLYQLFEQDDAGREYRASQPFYEGGEILWTTRFFDSASRLAKVHLPDENEINFSYAGDSVVIKDGNGHSTVKTYNCQGKIVRIKDAAGGITSYAYDALGRTTLITLADGTETELSYDLAGNKLSIREEATGLTTYSYNAVGKPVAVTDAAGRTVTYEYDELDRLVLKDLPGTGEDVHYNYDEPGVLNGIGMLSSRSDAAGFWRFGYDSAGRLTLKSLSIDGDTYIHQYTYDLGGRITGIRYPQGSVTEYSYTRGGNLAGVTFEGEAIAGWQEFNAQGKPGEMIYGNGLKTAYEYGEMGALRHLTTSRETEILQDLSYSFDASGQITSVYDNRPDAVKQRGGINTDATQFFVYDELDRLRGASGVYGDFHYAYDSVGNITEKEGLSFSYTGSRLTGGDITARYDEIGNMIARTCQGTDWDYGYTNDNRLAEIRSDGVLRALLTYADGGRRIKKRAFGPEKDDVLTTYYIEEGYEVQMNSAGTTRQTINIFGNGNILFSRTYGGSSPVAGTQAVDNHRLLATIYGGSVSGFWKGAFHQAAASLSHPKLPCFFQAGLLGLAVLLLLLFFSLSLLCNRECGPSRLPWKIVMLSMIVVFLFNGSPSLFAELSAPAHGIHPLGGYYYSHNHIGSSTVITDEEGRERTRVLYKPYGEIDGTHSTGEDLITRKFTGQELDAETGFYYFKGRYYDASSGRFITPDTYVDDPEEVQSFNRYAYSKNNPVNYVDPTGHFFKSIFKAIKKVFKAVVKVVKAIVKTVVKIVKAVVSIASRVVTFIWHNPVLRSALIAAVYTAAVILTGGGALTMGPLVMAGVKAAAVTAIMQSPVGRKLTMLLAQGLQKIGLEARAAGIISSLLVTTGVSAAVNFAVARIGGVSANEITSKQAEGRLNEFKSRGIAGSQDFAVSGKGTKFIDMMSNEIKEPKGTRFFEVWQNDKFVGMFAEKPLDGLEWLGGFAPRHTAAWTPAANLGSGLEMLHKNFGAQYAVLGVCHNSANNLLMQASGGFYSNQVIGWHNAMQYAFTSTVYQNHPWVLGYDY